MEVKAALERLREGVDEDLGTQFYLMESLWERKLWHQLTETLLEVYRDPRTAALRIPLFEEIVTRLHPHISVLAFVTCAIAASEQCDSPARSLDFMTRVTATIEENATTEEYVFAQLQEASLYNQLGQVVQVKRILDDAGRQVDDMQITQKDILAQYYDVSCEYYKGLADYTKYYHCALLYLACIDATLPLEQQQQRAHDLCMAALLATRIYNFGELVQHPVLNSLRHSEWSWLGELVLTVNEGGVPRFNQLRAVFVEKSPLLKNALPFLEQKICLMALCESVFKRHTSERTLPFSVIARETHLQAGAKVEVLVMKAFSLGLMRGTIDGIAQTVSFTWLQPRALSLEHMKTMRARLDQWDADVKRLGAFIQKQGEGVWQAA